MKSLTLTYMVISLLLLYGIFAQRVMADPATPEPKIISFPSLLITEIGFKDSKNDFITLQVFNDMNNGNGNTIKGLSLKDDSIFFTIDDDIYIRNGEKIFISFGENNDEIKTTNEGLQINLTKNGLTGTTEQLIVTNNNQKIIDAVCWVNSKPAKSEITDFEYLFNQSAWKNNDITSCINSDGISKDQLIQRKNPIIDTNSKDDWEIKIVNSETIQNINNNSDEEEKKDDDKDQETNPISKIKICDGEVIISEFLPNPLGKDSNQEWIEIMNSSGANCSLYGWQVDDREGGSKKYTITSSEIIPSGKYLLLPSWKTGLNLNNSEDSVRIFNYDGELTDSIAYEDAPENETYALNKETDNFTWTIKPTPLTENLFPKIPELRPKPKKKEESETKPSSKVTNGTLSDQLHITEVFPNPKGQDSEHEWIEIFNASDSEIKLGNWKLNTTNKTYNFKNIILKRQSYLILSDKELGFSLKNTDEKLTLNDFNNKEISTVTYEKSFESQSFMKITTIDDGTSTKSWIWTDNPTPGEANYIRYVYSGTINTFDETSGKLLLSVNSGQPNEKVLEILLLLSGEKLIDSIFTVGSRINVTVRKEDGNLILENYTLLEESSKPGQTTEGSSGLFYILISSVPPLGLLGYGAIKKFGLIKIV